MFFLLSDFFGQKKQTSLEWMFASFMVTLVMILKSAIRQNSCFTVTFYLDLIFKITGSKDSILSNRILFRSSVINKNFIFIMTMYVEKNFFFTYAYDIRVPIGNV